MGDEVATSNVNRAYSLGATSIAIFTFMLVFLYPRVATGEVNALVFQAALVVMGVATFSFLFAALYYYGASLASRFDDVERTHFSQRADRLWLLGCTVLFADPTLILIAVRLYAVAGAWLVLWLIYLVFVVRYFPRLQTPMKTSSRGEARTG